MTALHIAQDLRNTATETSVSSSSTSTRKQSFSNGLGQPLFTHLEIAQSKHMCDGYNDMKPNDGVFGTAFKNFVKGKGGVMAGK